MNTRGYYGSSGPAMRGHYRSRVRAGEYTDLASVTSRLDDIQKDLQVIEDNADRRSGGLFVLVTAGLIFTTVQLAKKSK